METFIQNLPKTELHIHIEGSLEPELMFEIAQRNGVTLRFASVEAVRQAYQIQQAFNLSHNNIYQLAKNAFQASFQQSN
ncbi:MAG TPA: hypothetical protein DCM38_14110 [Gammaproteobacteria bacterium]|nr:hypothetical protein [Gammaproteobacteria bacterium]